MHKEAFMNNRLAGPISGRRDFLRAVLPGGALLCLGGGRCLIGSPQVQGKPAEPGQKHKFQQDAGLSVTQVFSFAYLPQLGLLRGLEKEIGSETFAAMVKRIIDEETEKEFAEFAKKAGKNDLEAFTARFRRKGTLFDKTLTYEIVEDAPKAFEIKVTECLWAKTYREAGAGDLGYLLSCYGDYATARGFNPKMRMIRTKTLMQGDAFCNHRYVIEG
jgi:L-2-amino-thiazoline-4-carboxylic acid hydrolase